MKKLLVEARRPAGKSMKSWVQSHLNAGLTVGVLLVLLTYLIVSQQAATTSGSKGNTDLLTCFTSQVTAKTAVSYIFCVSMIVVVGVFPNPKSIN